MIPGKVYQLTQDKQKALLDFVTEQQAKGYIHPSKSPYAAPFFFIKRKMANYDQSKTTDDSMNGLLRTTTHFH